MHAADHMNAIPAPAEVVSRTMRAVVRREYGTPDVLSLGEAERPVAGDAEVLVRVHAVSPNVGDHHAVTGKPYLIRLTPFGGLPRPKNLVPGAMMAGVVEAVGARVTTFRPGDEVFGQASAGAFAEYVVLPAEHLAPKPSNLSFDEAAAVPWGATALQGLRDVAGLKAGQRVLVNGASGGVGTWTVQVAKALGADVTAVCSTRNVEMVRALGADEVLDYTKTDFAGGGARFDVMMDLVGNRPLSECRGVLKAGGIYLPCSGGGGDWVGPMMRILWGLLSSLFTSKKVKTFVMAPKRADLLFLKELVEAGKAKPVIERSYPLNEVVEALKHVGEGHARGQIVIRVAG